MVTLASTLLESLALSRIWPLQQYPRLGDLRLWYRSRAVAESRNLPIAPSSDVLLVAWNERKRSANGLFL